MWSRSQSIAMLIGPMVVGLVSFTASSTIIVMILRSETKLTKPFRRIIFGMCIYDIFQSASASASAFPSVEGSKMWAFGNTYTCVTQGFLNQLGITGSPMYSLSLAIFYLCVIKFNVRDTRFRTDIEPYLHLVPSLLAWFSAIFVASTGYINSAGNGCWIAPYPTKCIHNEDIECIRGKHAYLYRWIFSGIPILISFVLSAIIMVIICFTVTSQVDLNNRYRSEMWRAGTRLESDNNRIDENTNTNRIQAFFSSLVGSTIIESEVPARRTSTSSLPLRPRRSASTRRCRDVKEQSVLFITAFLFTYLFSYINRIVEQINGSSPFWLQLVARLMSANQGTFNILVYTRPHVTSFRRRNQDLSWLKAFWIVVKRGGDHDRANTRRNSSVVSRASIASSRPQPRTTFTRRLSNPHILPLNDVRAHVNVADNDDDEESKAGELEEMMNALDILSGERDESMSDDEPCNEERGAENQLSYDEKKDQISTSEQAPHRSQSSGIRYSSTDEYDLELGITSTAELILHDSGSLDGSSVETFKYREHTDRD